MDRSEDRLERQPASTCFDGTPQRNRAFLPNSRNGLYQPHREQLDEAVLETILRQFAVEHLRFGYRRYWRHLEHVGTVISLKSAYRIWKKFRHESVSPWLERRRSLLTPGL